MYVCMYVCMYVRCCKLASWFMRHGGLGINHLCWNTYLYNHRRRVQTEQRLKHAGKVWSCKFRCESLLPKTKPGRCGQWSSWRNKDGSNWRHWPHALPEWPISFRSRCFTVTVRKQPPHMSRNDIRDFSLFLMVPCGWRVDRKHCLSSRY